MKQDITVTRSRSISLCVYVTDSNGDPYTLDTSEKLIFGVKKNLSDDDYLIKKIATSSNLVDGAYIFNLEPSDTDNMIAPKTYFYDVGLQTETEYLSVVETSMLFLDANVSVKEN